MSTKAKIVTDDGSPEAFNPTLNFIYAFLGDLEKFQNGRLVKVVAIWGNDFGILPLGLCKHVLIIKRELVRVAACVAWLNRQTASRATDIKNRFQKEMNEE